MATLPLLGAKPCAGRTGLFQQPGPLTEHPFLRANFIHVDVSCSCDLVALKPLCPSPEAVPLRGLCLGTAQRETWVPSCHSRDEMSHGAWPTRWLHPLLPWPRLRERLLASVSHTVLCRLWKKPISAPLSPPLSFFLSLLSSLSFPPSRQTVSGCLFCPCRVCRNRGGVRCGAATSSGVSEAIERWQPGGDKSIPLPIPLPIIQPTWVSLVQTFSWTRPIIAAESLAVSGSKSVMDGSGLGFNEPAPSSSIFIQISNRPPPSHPLGRSPGKRFLLSCPQGTAEVASGVGHRAGMLLTGWGGTTPELLWGQP